MKDGIFAFVVSIICLVVMVGFGIVELSGDMVSLPTVGEEFTLIQSDNNTNYKLVHSSINIPLSLDSFKDIEIAWWADGIVVPRLFRAAKIGYELAENAFATLENERLEKEWELNIKR